MFFLTYVKGHHLSRQVIRKPEQFFSLHTSLSKMVHKTKKGLVLGANPARAYLAVDKALSGVLSDLISCLNVL